MKSFSKILWGTVFIILGIVIALNALEITSINIFFRGWWTLFIIIPCLIGICDSESESKTGNIIGLIIGLCLLLAIRDIISFELIRKLMIPFIFLAIGFSIIFNEGIKSKISAKVRER